MRLLTKKFDDPATFSTMIPEELVENVLFRKKLHGLLTKDVGLQQVYKEICLAAPEIWFATSGWTFDPRQPIGLQNIPFLLRPQQKVAIRALKDAIDNQHDLAFDKTREEGATEIICKIFALYWWLKPDIYFLVGSRKEDLVDKSVECRHGRLVGPHQTLFHKIMYAIINLPAWAQANFSKKHLYLQNLDNNATIEGESTNESFGAGNRATAVLVDEAARIDPEPAQQIIDTIHDTTRCAIFNSTHFRWGSAHPYAALLRSNKIPVVTLGYETNPSKAEGLYYSPKKGVVDIVDIEYWKKRAPEIFEYAEIESGN